jgi:hypothetical protein
LFTPVLDIATVSVCDLSLLPYPDAAEVAGALGACASGLRSPEERYFADPALIENSLQQATMLLPTRPHKRR